MAQTRDAATGESPIVDVLVSRAISPLVPTADAEKQGLNSRKRSAPEPADDARAQTRSTTTTTTNTTTSTLATGTGTEGRAKHQPNGRKKVKRDLVNPVIVHEGDLLQSPSQY
jgi:hypothetical protein